VGVQHLNDPTQIIENPRDAEKKVSARVSYDKILLEFAV
jgi:hypothetical protein